MAKEFSHGFTITVQEPIDDRLIKTKEDMKKVSWARMPAKYFCLCSEDNRFYIFDSEIGPEEEDPFTGCYRPIDTFLNLADVAGTLDGGKVTIN